MRYELIIKVPGLPKRINELSGRTWQKIRTERQRWFKTIGLVTAGKRPDTPLRKAKLTCIRHSSSAPDYDGLVSSFKQVIDALIQVGIIQDDNMGVIGVPEFKWSKTERKNGHITIRVESLNGE